MNTGWTGGPYGVGLANQAGLYARHHRRDPRRLAVASADGARRSLEAPDSDVLSGRARKLLQPGEYVGEPQAYDQAAAQLAALFRENFAKNADRAPMGSRVEPTSRSIKVGRELSETSRFPSSATELVFIAALSVPADNSDRASRPDEPLRSGCLAP